MNTLPLSTPVRMMATLALGAVCALAACSQPRSSAEGSTVDGTLLTLSSYAEARRQPDIAVLSTGVVTLAPDANSAMRRNAEQMSRVMGAIKAAGVAAKDVQTSGVSLNPDYQYLANRPPRIKGYYASNTVSVTVRDVGELGEILDGLVATGANQINGPTFDIEDKDAVLDEARGKALVKARIRADAYGKRLGVRVKRVISIDETGGRANPRAVSVRGVAVEQASAANASAPIAPGESVLGIALEVVYELGK